MNLSEMLGRDVSRETHAKLTRFQDMLLEANQTQNLISKSSVAQFEQRHLLDSAQLLRFAKSGASWADVGSGAGLPGIVLAILDDGPKLLIEPRRLRTDFLAAVVSELQLSNVEIATGKAQNCQGHFDIITARALAELGTIFAITETLRHSRTIYILPKGRSAQSELEASSKTWQGRYRLEPSLTSEGASILIVDDVKARRGK